MPKLQEKPDAVDLTISFQSFAAEGDNLAKQGEYQKAIEAYSQVEDFN